MGKVTMRCRYICARRFVDLEVIHSVAIARCLFFKGGGEKEFPENNFLYGRLHVGEHFDVSVIIEKIWYQKHVVICCFKCLQIYKPYIA